MLPPVVGGVRLIRKVGTFLVLVEEEDDCVETADSFFVPSMPFGCDLEDGLFLEEEVEDVEGCNFFNKFAVESLSVGEGSLWVDDVLPGLLAGVVVALEEDRRIVGRDDDPDFLGASLLLLLFPFFSFCLFVDEFN